MTHWSFNSFVYLLFAIIHLSDSSHRWQPRRSNIYRKALAKILIHECNANRCLMCQIKNDAHPFMVYEDTFSCLGDPPAVTIQDYISEIYYHLHFDGNLIDDGIFVIAILYMGRLMERTRVKVTYWNVHRILSMSTWMACKMQYDVSFYINRSAPEAFGTDAEGMTVLL